jgi:hypothetical protein
MYCNMYLCGERYLHIYIQEQDKYGFYAFSGVGSSPRPLLLTLPERPPPFFSPWSFSSLWQVEPFVCISYRGVDVGLEPILLRHQKKTCILYIFFSMMYNKYTISFKNLFKIPYFSNFKSNCNRYILKSTYFLH